MKARNLDLFADRSTEPAGPPAPKVWTVSQVNRAVRRLLEETLPQLWVTGEVANFNRHRSGHCYFTLKDRSAQIRCVMFRREAATLPTDPEEGMTLRVFGGLTLYEARGSYQFVVSRLEAESAEGMWKLAFERLRQRLDTEGLTDPARKRPLPDFPRTVGVVTSATSAALRDILAVTARRAPWVRVLVRGTGVQGPGAGRQIAAAIDTVAARGVDVVIVARGGGSIEDLWGFNEEPVARAVAACPVPVVSGVGHETDVTICDLVADLRAATPSAAAEAVAPDGRALGRRLVALGQRLGRALSGQAQCQALASRPGPGAAVRRCAPAGECVSATAAGRARGHLAGDAGTDPAPQRATEGSRGGHGGAFPPVHPGPRICRAAGREWPPAAGRRRLCSRREIPVARHGRECAVRGGGPAHPRIVGRSIMESDAGLDRRLERIEEIVRLLDSDSLGLDEALALFEEGVGHIRRAREVLARTELRVEELIGEEGRGGARVRAGRRRGRRRRRGWLNRVSRR